MTEAFENGGFETGSLPPWVGDGIVVSTIQYSGIYSAEMDLNNYIEQTFGIAIAKAWCSSFGFWGIGSGNVEVTLYFSDATSKTHDKGIGYPYDEWHYLDILTWVVNPCTGELLFPADKKVTKIRITSRYGLAHIDDATLQYELIPLRIIGSSTFTSKDVLSVKRRETSNVAIRDIPLRSAGPKVDTDIWTHKPITLEIEFRASTAEKTTIQTIFDANDFVTVELNSESGTWTFSNCWIDDKKITYEYSKSTDGVEREWRIRLVILSESATFEGG
jgi:hypothetical protein